MDSPIKDFKPKPIRLDTIYDLKAFAIDKGGICLSNSYSGVSQNYQWRCACGNEWFARWSNVGDHGTWCPTCSSGSGERICRAILELMFGEIFKKSTPDWLQSENKKPGRRLELDGYNDHLKIAFEYQGFQHYEPLTSGYGPSEESVLATKLRDLLKRNRCSSNFVSLIIIPETRGVSNIAGCISQVEQSVIDAGLKMPIGWKNNKPTKFSDLNLPVDSSAMQRMHDMASANGGLCLSTDYVHSRATMEWMCSNGHVWRVSSDRIRSGGWCRVCRKEEANRRVI